MPMRCLFSSRSMVIPSSMSMLSSILASLSCMYKASASLSYSIFTANHLHPVFFFTAVMTRNLSFSSLYVTRKNLSGVFIHTFILSPPDTSKNSGCSIADTISLSVTACRRILFLACRVNLTGFMLKDINILKANLQREKKYVKENWRWIPAEVHPVPETGPEHLMVAVYGGRHAQ